MEIVYRSLEDYGPKLADMGWEEFERWTERLATAAEGDFGSFLGRILPVVQIQLLMAQAKEIVSLRKKLSELEKTATTSSQTDSLSANSLPENSTNELKSEEQNQSQDPSQS